MKLKNTPFKIVTRATGATFYCAACHKTYQKCQCPVYQSVDTLSSGKTGKLRRRKGHL